MSQALAKEIKEKQKSTETGAAEDEQLRKYLLSLVNASASSTVPANLRNASADVALPSAMPDKIHVPPTLHNILARAKIT